MKISVQVLITYETTLSIFNISVLSAIHLTNTIVKVCRIHKKPNSDLDTLKYTHRNTYKYLIYKNKNDSMVPLKNRIQQFSMTGN